jgi:Ran GTPase-activating protein (RanGAP) involved in mRNA processing and transport
MVQCTCVAHALRRATQFAPPPGCFSRLVSSNTEVLHCKCSYGLTLQEVVRWLQALATVELQSNDIGAAAANTLLSSPGHVAHLNLSKCGLGATCMASMLQHWTSCSKGSLLAIVSLSDNCSGDGNAQHLCAAILANRQLRRLDLSGCQLGHETGRKLLHLTQSLAQAKAAKGRKHALGVRTKPATCKLKSTSCGLHSGDLLFTPECCVHTQCVLC